MRLFVIALMLFLSGASPAQTFTSTSGGNIPDGAASAANSYGAPLDVPIVVSGVANGTIETLSVAFSANHSFVGDLEVTLISPYGQEHLLFARTGATNNDGGSSANLVAANSYAFSDVPANPNWWTAAGLADVNIPSATARTVLSGGPGVTNPAPLTSILSVFQRRPPNGIWKLRFRDGWQGDIGNVSSASITLTTTGVTRTVTKIEDTNDSDCSPTDCSLREAITASSDGSSSVDRIEFARPFFDTPRRIVLNSNLDTTSPVFAWVGPGATSLTISGRGLYSMQFGTSAGLRSFAGTRIAEVTGFSASGTPLLHGMEFAFVQGRIGFPTCEINDSSVHSSTGGVFDQINLFGSGSSTFRRVTISQNTVSSASQAATIFASGNLNIIDSTIVQNQATGQDAIGGILSRSVVRLRNSVVAGNRANGTISSGQDLGSRDGGSFQSLGHNVIGDVGSVTTINQPSDQTGTTAAPLNPVLSPLSRHGGLIPVHVPLPGSPLLDQGRRVSRDARGVALVDLGDFANASGGNGGDIGAVELSPLLVTNLNDSGSGSLRQAILDAPVAPAVSDILFAGSFPPAAKIALTSGELVINKNLSIHGFGAKKLTVSGNRQSRVLAVQPSARVSISGLSLADGNGTGLSTGNGGGILISFPGSQLSVVQSVLRNGNNVNGIGGWSLFGFGEFIDSTASNMRTNTLIATNDNAMATLYRATISGCSNECLAVGFESEASIIDSTFAASSAEVVAILGRAFTRNTVFDGAVRVSAAGVLISGGHNLIGSTASTAFTGPDDQVGTIAAPIAVRLSPLAYHGGPVPTQVPLAGSPALDKGRRSGADARGLRSFDIASIAAATNGDDSDIGAVEAQALFVINTNDSGTGSLRQAVLDANANGVAFDDVLFDLPPASTINLLGRLPNPVAGGTLNLLGPGANQLIIRGNIAHQLFSFTAPGHLGLSRLMLRDFRGVDGPALEAYQTEVHLTELQVLSNAASRDGGAMLIGDADAVIESSTFAGNTAASNHGALAYLGNNSRLLVRNSTFSSNSGPTSSAIANVARGAGISVLELESNTFADNIGSAALTSMASSSGAAVSRAQSTLFSGTASSIANIGANASFVSRGFNLSSTSEPLLNQSTDRVNANPNLGPLQDNGGATLTRALQYPSAAVDAGIRSTEVDQRGSFRTRNLFSVADAPGSDGTDIGAFELQTSPDNPPLVSLVPSRGTISYSASGAALPIVATPSDGSGNGPGATTTLGACNITAGGAAFPTTTIAQLSFVGNTTTAQNLNLPNCVPQSTATNATLTCPLVLGTFPLTRTWTLNCPAMAAELIFRNGFEN